MTRISGVQCARDEVPGPRQLLSVGMIPHWCLTKSYLGYRLSYKSSSPTRGISCRLGSRAMTRFMIAENE